MNIGQRLLDLRKSKQLSQEEVADKLNVTRQTISKWETEQSMPDFDKIAPLCELYGITADELLTGKKEEGQDKVEQPLNKGYVKEKRAKGIGLAILLYFVSIVWIMIAIPVLMMNPIVASGIFLLICGVATYIIVYTCMVYKIEKQKKEEKETKLIKQIDSILSIFTLIIYFIISFATMAWYITWIIWIIYALVIEIIKLIFQLKGKEYEE